MADWWYRILIFVCLGLVFAFLYDFILSYLLPDYNDVVDFLFYIFLIFPLLISIIVAKFRINNYWWTFGIRFDKWMLRDIAFAAILIISIIILNILLVFILDFQSLSDVSVNINFTFYTLSDVFFIFIWAANEELLFRGIIFQALIDKFGNILPTIIISSVFVFVHSSITFISGMNIFLAGVLMSVMYIQTRSLWLPIFFHFFWNFGLAFFLGSRISVYRLIDPLFDFSLHEYSILLFGTENFGLESGLISTIVLLIAISIVIKKGSISPYMSSVLFKMQYFEAKFINKPKMFNVK
jgi:membrane protease YdiL (CAAX protease family)